MNLRVVIAVALAAALLGVSMPVIEEVRVTQGEARVSGALDRVERAASELRATNDAMADPDVAATRELTLHLPAGSFGTAGLVRLGVEETGPNEALVRWRVSGGRTHARRLVGIDLPPDARSAFRDVGGRVTVRLRLLRRNGTRVVSLAVPDFTTERATSRGHVRPARPRF